MSVKSSLISVVLPVYNAENYLGDAISSILKQTYVNFELIIINDGSTDQSHEIIVSFSDSRIRYIHRENRGISKTLNEGLALAQGQYIARMDADDISYPTRLEQQVAFLNAFPGYVLTCGNMRLINERGNTVQKKLFFRRFYASSPPLEWLLLWETPIPHPTVMMRAEILKKNGLTYLDEKAEDSALWRELVFYGLMHRSDEVLLDYRVHEKSLSQQNMNSVMGSAVEQAKRYGLRLGLDDLEDFLIYSIGYGVFVEDKTLRPYSAFHHFVVKSIEQCNQVWPMTKGEKRCCEQYADFMYFSTMLRLKSLKGVLFSLVCHFHYPMLELLMQRIRDKSKRIWNALFARVAQ